MALYEGPGGPGALLPFLNRSAARIEPRAECGVVFLELQPQSTNEVGQGSVGGPRRHIGSIAQAWLHCGYRRSPAPIKMTPRSIRPQMPNANQSAHVAARHSSMSCSRNGILVTPGRSPR